MPKTVAKKYMGMTIYKHTLKSGKIYYSFSGGAKYGYPSISAAQNAIFAKKAKKIKGRRL